MEFLYNPNPTFEIEWTGEQYKYLFRVRRAQVGEQVPVRNLRDDYLYLYQITQVDRRRGVGKLVEKRLEPRHPHRYLHLGWCVVDPKIVEKGIRPLNEIGVSKISFVYCDRSQRNFKLRLDRIERILIESAQQCGRSRLPEIEILESSDHFFEKYPNFVAVDFGGREPTPGIEVVLVGPEGGFSPRERALFREVVGLKGFILRSETAACGIASKLLL